MGRERSVRTRRTVAVAIQVIIAFILFIAIGGVAVLELWNWLLPPLFGAPQIGFLQALGILALSRILFGGSGLPTIKRPRSRRPTTDRWEALTPEERERLRQGARGLDAPEGGSAGQ
jgi:hypothetical protein